MMVRGEFVLAALALARAAIAGDIYALLRCEWMTSRISFGEEKLSVVQLL